MKEEILRILELEKQGKLTTEQAAELLAALADHRGEPAGTPQPTAGGSGEPPSRRRRPRPFPHRVLRPCAAWSAPAAW